MLSSHVPDWLLERLAAGELSEGQATALKARLEHAGELHRLAAIEKSNAEILAQLPPSQVVGEIHRRAERAERRAKATRVRLSLGLATACAAGLAVLLFFKVDPEEILLKGSHPPQLRIYRRTTQGPESLDPRQPLRAGDALQIRYLSAQHKYGVIASIDARGTVTMHLPERPGAAVPLQQEGEFALPHSYELDDSPGFERFLFVAADEPFSSTLATDILAKNSTPSDKFAFFAVTFKKATP